MTDRLRKSGIRAETFHAKMPTAAKASILKRWKEGKLDCVCATIAFGMVSFPFDARNKRQNLMG